MCTCLVADNYYRNLRANREDRMAIVAKWQLVKRFTRRVLYFIGGKITAYKNWLTGHVSCETRVHLPLSIITPIKSTDDKILLLLSTLEL